MPAGRLSVSVRLLATAVPEFVYERVTVTVAPAGPLLDESALVTPITELATVVVSVLVCVVGVVSETEATRSALAPLAAAAGTVPAITKRNTPPATIAPEVVIGVALSGTPSPFASRKYAGEACGPAAPKLV